MRMVLEELHMRALDKGVELSISDAASDEKGQLIDLESTLGPFAEAVRAMDMNLVDFVVDDQGR